MAVKENFDDKYLLAARAAKVPVAVELLSGEVHAAATLLYVNRYSITIRDNGEFWIPKHAIKRVGPSR